MRGLFFSRPQIHLTHDTQVWAHTVHCVFDSVNLFFFLCTSLEHSCYVLVCGRKSNRKSVASFNCPLDTSSTAPLPGSGLVLALSNTVSLFSIFLVMKQCRYVSVPLFTGTVSCCVVLLKALSLLWSSLWGLCWPEHFGIFLFGSPAVACEILTCVSNMEHLTNWIGRIGARNGAERSLTVQRGVSRPQRPQHLKDHPGGRCRHPDTQPWQNTRVVRQHVATTSWFKLKSFVLYLFSRFVLLLPR